MKWIRFSVLVALVMTSGCSKNREELFKAVRAGDYRALIALSPSRSEVNSRSFGMTLLQRAVISGNTNIVIFLIETGAKVDARSDTGATAMIYAATSKDLSCARILLEAGAHIDVVDEMGRGVVHYAAQSVRDGNLENIEAWLLFAIEQGVDLNQTDVHGMTALDMTYIYGNKNIYELVRRMGGLSGMDVREKKKVALSYDERRRGQSLNLVISD